MVILMFFGHAITYHLWIRPIHKLRNEQHLPRFEAEKAEQNLFKEKPS